MDCWQALANAVVAQAAKDYIAALRALAKSEQNVTALVKAMELEDFFQSRWFGVLTQVDPDFLIERLRKEAAV